jgi:DNA-binding NarL/FixJ family response regulator
MDDIIKVITVDDHPLILSGVTAALEKNSRNIKVIGTASTAEEMMNMLRGLGPTGLHELPDVILLDLMLPGMQGEEAAKILKKDYPSIKILVFSAETSENVIYRLLQLGIDGFVNKTSSGREIAAAVECVGSGNQYFGMDTARILENVHVAKGHKCKEMCSMFSDREMDVMRLCCEGFLSKEIADKLDISPRTVDNHKRNIFHKLGINNSLELVKYALTNDIIKL